MLIGYRFYKISDSLALRSEFSISSCPFCLLLSKVVPEHVSSRGNAADGVLKLERTALRKKAKWKHACSVRHNAKSPAHCDPRHV